MKDRDAFTKTELIYLPFLDAGLSNGEIAVKMFVSQQTVKYHLSNIYRKLEVSNRAQAVFVARSMGLIAGSRIIAQAMEDIRTGDNIVIDAATGQARRQGGQ